MIPVGLDLIQFPYLFNPTSKERILFTDKMGYEPNIDSAVFFAKSYFPVTDLKSKDWIKQHFKFIILGMRHLFNTNFGKKMVLGRVKLNAFTIVVKMNLNFLTIP